jgi:hypothetical protein
MHPAVARSYTNVKAVVTLRSLAQEFALQHREFC